MATVFEPITPSAAREKATKVQRSKIPGIVYVVVNDLIAQNLRSGEARVLQEDIVKALCKHQRVTRKKIFAGNWLDFEDVYREAGWEVVYDRPGYDESYPAVFIFRIR